MADRTPCCIPFCGRTTEKPFAEWICQKHWSTTSKRWRGFYARRKRRWRKGDLTQGPKLARLWEKLKSQAMEGAMFQ
ncbi:hypothetical protein [Leisingera sp. M523]|uniref:hypothetical protein n=1 Tax=Leisingera sp. M523 TaxID=2867013 RepID=UPI0021A6E21E|nr:hypothetical protein [Leisingera sp. M523]UWQ30236.1 hypothetical protein K3557_06785 [Leisingera sp. M523]